MTTHKPSADHPWKRDRYKSASQARSPVLFSKMPKTEHDRAVLEEIHAARFIEKMPLMPSPLEETQYSDRDMLVLCSEGCRQRKAMRYG